MNAKPLRYLADWWSERRNERGSDTYSPEDLEMFRDALAEGKALRRHRRRRIRPALLREGGES